MDLSGQVISVKNAVVNKWSGGTTSELYIYPIKSRFSKRNFDFRVSLATVASTPSQFTPLANIKRTTLILEGELTLQHEGHHSTNLRRLDQDSYDGGWETSSVGQSTNFNVMTRGPVQTVVTTHQLEQDEQLACPVDEKLCIYLHKGRIAIIIFNDATILESGQLFIVPDDAPLVIVKALEESELVTAGFKKN